MILEQVIHTMICAQNHVSYNISLELIQIAEMIEDNWRKPNLYEKNFSYYRKSVDLQDMDHKLKKSDSLLGTIFRQILVLLRQFIICQAIVWSVGSASIKISIEL